MEVLVRKGLSVIIAPEGTRSADGELGPFKKGAFRIAMATGLPIVPIVVRNAEMIGDRGCTRDAAGHGRRGGAGAHPRRRLDTGQPQRQDRRRPQPHPRDLAPMAELNAERLSAEDAAFRDELRDWLADHLVGEFRAARGVGGPADDRGWDVRLAWEKELAAARWLNISWPEEYGGRGGTAPPGAALPHRARRRRGALLGRGAGPRPVRPDAARVRHRGAEEAVPARRSPACEEFWGQGFSEPDAGLRPRRAARPEPSATATSG